MRASVEMRAPAGSGAPEGIWGQSGICTARGQQAAGVERARCVGKGTWGTEAG